MPLGPHGGQIAEVADMRSYRIETSPDGGDSVRLVELWSPQNTEPTYSHTFDSWSDAASAVRTVGAHLAYTIGGKAEVLIDLLYGVDS